MTMLTRLAFILALAGATFAACDARAATDECSRAMGAAEASAFTASRTQHACMDPDECQVADQLVRAATAQLEAARAMCGEPAPASASTPDPFAADPVDDTGPAAWVVTEQVAEDFGWRVAP